MTRPSLTATIIWVILTFLPGISQADLVALTDSQMRETSGRFGPSGQTNWVDISHSLEKIYYEDGDGIGNQQPAYISLTGIELMGRRSLDPSADAAHQAADTILGVFGLASMLHEWQNMEIEIDYFHIDAIRVGPSPGEGLSFGSITMTGLKMSMEGVISVTASSR